MSTLFSLVVTPTTTPTPTPTPPAVAVAVGFIVRGAGLRQFEKCSIRVLSDIALVHPKERTDRSIDGTTMT